MTKQDKIDLMIKLASYANYEGYNLTQQDIENIDNSYQNATDTFPNYDIITQEQELMEFALQTLECEYYSTYEKLFS